MGKTFRVSGSKAHRPWLQGQVRLHYINRYTFGRKRADAKRFAEVWKERNPNLPLPKNLEVYEISEYGRRPTKAELKFLRE